MRGKETSKSEVGRIRDRVEKPLHGEGKRECTDKIKGVRNRISGIRREGKRVRGGENQLRMRR